MPESRRVPSSVLRAWLRCSTERSDRYSLRFEVDAGVARVLPLPSHVSADLATGVAAGLIHQLDVHELFALQFLVADSQSGPWRGQPVLQDCGEILYEVRDDEWSVLWDEGAPVEDPACAIAAAEALAAMVNMPPLLRDDAPTEVGMLSMPSIDEEPLPPLDADAPTDLNLLPPPMARLHALRRHRRIGR